MGSETDNNQNIDLDNPEFVKLRALIDHTNRSVFLTGKAGTGKSTFLRYITANTTKKFVVLAPTGIAAVNVGGQTLHSFFLLPFKPLMPDDPDFQPKRLRARLKYSREKVKLIKELELIIIDEISMVRADIIDFLDKILRVFTGNRRQPFGGKQMLFVGDIFQLEPVVTGDMRDILRRSYHTPYFFNAHVFDDFALVPIELRKVYRQRDSDFIGMLDRVRVGAPLPDDLRRINARVGQSDTPAGDDDGRLTMTIAARRETVDHINESRLEALKTPLRTYMGQVTGEFPENAYPTDLQLVLREGAQVVFIKNDPSRRWVNGSLGRVVEADDDSISVCLENGETHRVEIEKWGNIRYRYDEETGKVTEEEIGTFTQYPVKLAWALTIHKSQGLTFDHIVIDVGRGAFAGGQSYVALSRCTSLEGITLMSTLNERDIFVDPAIQRFSRRFNDDRLIGEALTDAEADEAYRQAARAFDTADYRRAAEQLCTAVGKRNDLGRPSAARLISAKLAEANCLRRRIAELEGRLEANRRRFEALAREYVEMADECRADGWDLHAALANYDKALSLCESYAPALLGKGLALLAAGDADAGCEALLQACDADTADWRAPYELGRHYGAAGDPANALDRLMLALERNDRIAVIYDAAADVYEGVGDKSSARAHRTMARNLRKGKR